MGGCLPLIIPMKDFKFSVQTYLPFDVGKLHKVTESSNDGFCLGGLSLSSERYVVFVLRKFNMDSK